jgi:hypothetical protein
LLKLLLLKVETLLELLLKSQALKETTHLEKFWLRTCTFNNNLVISWRSVLLVGGNGVPGENHRPVASHWQTLSHNVVSSTLHLFFFINVSGWWKYKININLNDSQIKFAISKKKKIEKIQAMHNIEQKQNVYLYIQVQWFRPCFTAIKLSRKTPKSSNQKQELPVVAMFVNGSEQN